MEPKFQSSFIPKASLGQEAKKTAKSQAAAMGLVTLAALILFLSAVALSVGVFLYQQFLTASIESKTQSLARAREAFEPALLEELARLDKRINTAQGLLNNHVAPTALFTALEESTLENVRFKSFVYSVLEPGKIDIIMEGEAESFAAVALQSDIFGNSRLIREPIFSDLNLDQEGDVVFNVSATLDPSLMTFKSTLGEQGTGAPASTQPSGSPQSVGGGAAQVAQAASVSIQGRAFTPGTITVARGTTVTFTNNDSAPHTVTSDAGSNRGGLSSDTLQTGDTYSFTFNEPGTYAYHCEIHPAMKATITVTE